MKSNQNFYDHALIMGKRGRQVNPRLLVSKNFVRSKNKSSANIITTFNERKNSQILIDNMNAIQGHNDQAT